MPNSGTRAPSLEILLPLDRVASESLRSQLIAGLRTAIRSGALPAGQAIPSSRVLATELSVSRRLVVEAYEQLVAEGYLRSSPRSGTVVGDTATAVASYPPRTEPSRVRYDLRPGIPDLSAFPTASWRRATNHALTLPPAGLLSYPDPQGWWPLRVELAGYLRRVRGVDVAADRVVVCSSAANALSLLVSALLEQGCATVGIENPGMVGRDRVISRAGGCWRTLDVDDDGLRIDQLRASDLTAVLVSPAHQFPTGAALSLERRAELARWAASGGLLIEDDYDAEFRYDRAPIGALQGLVPNQVAYVGTTSKSLAPGLRLAWLAVPERLVDPVVRAKQETDGGTSTPLQATFATFLSRGDYDRHLRSMRHRYRRRRDALVTALEQHLPSLPVGGAAAGLHITLGIPDGTDRPALRSALRDRQVETGWTDDFRAGPATGPGRLVLGYGNLDSAAVDEAVVQLRRGLASRGIVGE